jgi:predicted flavoprotein YhiN
VSTPVLASDRCDIAIVGAGAAGMMAAICAGRALRQRNADATLVVLDGARRIGAKILVSGGGRCNVTHDVVRPEDFAGPSRNRVKKILASFTVEQTIAFFEELGVRLKREDTGKLFPISDQARTVLDALQRAMQRAGAELRENHRVTAIEICNDHSPPTTSARPDHQTQLPGAAPTLSAGYTRFKIHHAQGTLHASRLILATGGLSLPKTGSDGFGYELAKRLGHTVTDTWPALVPLVLTHNHWLTDLPGVSADVELFVAARTGRVLHRQRGAMLATHFGVSGPAPMDISRHLTAARRDDPDASLRCNFTDGLTFEQADTKLLNRAQRDPKATALDALPRRLPQRLTRALLERELGIEPQTTLAHLPKDDRQAIARALTQLHLPVRRDRGYLHAEVTAGGVPLDEIELKTMGSRRCDGLHLCGEMIDCDGRIGGYNFQWAWCTGRLAGLAAAEALPCAEVA